MRKTSLVLLSMMVLGMCATIANAQGTGIYFSGNLGGIRVMDSDVTWYDGFQDEAKFDTGIVTTVAIGWDFGIGLRPEFELGFRFNEVDRQFPNGIGGEIYSSSIMGNLFFDFIPHQRVSPFIGAGVGFANVEVDLDFWGSDDDTVFAYQFMAGLSFAVSRNINIDLQYRYFATEDPEFDFFESEYKTHSVMGGIRIRF